MNLDDDDFGLHYDRQGNRISWRRWAELHGSSYKIIAQHQVAESWVSTVWLGLDHGFGHGPPVIFETLVFGGPLNDEGMRYSTEAQAFEGHAYWCAKAAESQGVLLAEVMTEKRADQDQDD